MKIPSVRSVTPSTRPKGPARADGSGFALDQTQAAHARASSAQTDKAAPVASLDALLALQGADAPPADLRAQAVARGGALLDALDGLKRDVIDGRAPAGRIEALRMAAAQPREATGDGPLEAVLDAVDVRAAVELAKHDRSLTKRSR